MNKIVSLDAKKKSPQAILKLLSNRGHFYFSYNSSLFDRDTLVDITVSNKPVKQVLDVLLAGRCEYVESGNYIIIRRLPVALPLVTKKEVSRQKYYLVSGLISDAQAADGIAGASIYEQTGLAASLTDRQGRFRLKLRAANKPVFITISKENYLDTAIRFSPRSNQQFSISLAPIARERMAVIRPEDEPAPLDTLFLRPVALVINKNDSNPIGKTGIARFFIDSKQRLHSINLSRFFTTRAYQVSLIPGWGTHGKISAQVINHVSFNVLGGYNGGVEGVEAGGLFNIHKKSVEHVQVAGLFNVVGGGVKGVQVAGINNTALQQVHGIQVAGISNRVEAFMGGVQVGGIYNRVDAPVKGLQVAGLFNAAADSVRGLQLAGLVNWSRQSRGFQVAGLVNYTRHLRGLQLGIVNIADTSDGWSIGLVSVVRHGYHAFSVYTDEMLNAGLAFKSGNRKLLGGVFDLHLRKGNNEKTEYTLQAGLLGLNAAAEGPLLGKGGSYVINYRYSTLSLLSKLGLPLEGQTNFQDLSYHIFLPTKKGGSFSLFGFGGLSAQHTKALTDSSQWSEEGDRYTSRFVSNTAASGLTHHIQLGSRTSLHSAIGYSYNSIADNSLYFVKSDLLQEQYKEDYKTSRWTVSSSFNRKFSPKSTLRAGAMVNVLGFDYYQRSRKHINAPMRILLQRRDQTETIQSFAQWQFKPTDKLSLNAGFHYLALLYNHTHSLEPRASLNWAADGRSTVSAGFGRHSQLQPLGVYFAQLMTPEGNTVYPKRFLPFTKANHYVLSYRYSVNRHLALKAETYYQQLFDVPVSTSDTNTFSTLNIQSDYIADPLVSKGTGKNYGMEFSVERNLSQGFYATASTSLYRSRYKASDGIERNTRYNGGYLINGVAGKEFYAKAKTVGVNIRTIFAGGLRATPIDAARSALEGYAVYDQKKAFTQQNPAYFRTDLRLSMQWNKKKQTNTLSLDIQNLTNRKNVYGEYFNAANGKVITAYQNGLIPVLNFKTEF